ncbi:MAG: peptidylprolyl isomerase [Meiothermus sp.]|uniref:peptidylprolyl isomerase n=1 Tax=Meiothermus sp. TaxID=1955249 RepID=UPI0025F354DB|nr:peptidylprolyl isomerase [Meiothermus sp.]MCS7069817.1 peptidylprolyl isomerase [Meiothermus sp.]MCX7601383.1 peptidylprolyl isomerase [Meiothermus sp.]
MTLKQVPVLLLLMLFPLALAQTDPVVARVGKSSITKSQFDLQFRLFLRDVLQQRGQAYSPEAEEAFAQFRPQYLERMARDQAIILAAEATGFAARGAAVDEAIQEVKSQFETEEQLQQALEEAGIPSLEAYRKLVYEALTYNAYLENLIKRLQTSEAALRILYLVSKSEYAVPVRYCSSHILVNTAQEANQVIARLGKGEKFADLAKELSQDPGSKNEGGELGCEPRGTFVLPFELALMALKPGESSRTPVRTEFGFHVILLSKVEAAGFQPFEQVKGGLDQSVKNSALQKVLDNIVSRTPIQLFPENLTGK